MLQASSVGELAVWLSHWWNKGNFATLAAGTEGFVEAKGSEQPCSSMKRQTFMERSYIFSKIDEQIVVERCWKYHLLPGSKARNKRGTGMETQSL